MRPFLAFVPLALVLAGCAGDAPAPAPPPFMTEAAAKALLLDAISNVPAVFGANFTLSTGGSQTLSIRATWDSPANTSYLDVGGDPKSLESLMGRAGAGDYLREGVVVYAMPAVALYLANGTAYVQPAGDANASATSVVPPPSQGPLGALVGADKLIRAIGASSLNITSVEAATYEGEPAALVGIRSTEGGRTTVGTLVVTLSPPRVRELDLVLGSASRSDPLADARLAGRLLYAESEFPRPSAQALRALALGYETSRPTPGDRANLTWTFLGAGEPVPLDEVEVEVKALGTRLSIDPRGLDTEWTLPLSEGSRTVGNVTLAFTDVDGDGKLSKGDTLVASAAEGSALPPLLLHDTKTDLRVVPGAGLFALVAALGGALLLARRRVH